MRRQRPYRVLVLPGGSEIGLEIAAALGDAKEVRLLSGGTDVPNHAPFAFSCHLTLPSVFEPGWIEALNAAIDQHSVDFIYPAYDDVLLALAEHADEIRACIVTSPLETCRIARSKSKTYDVLREIVPTPRVFDDPEAVTEYPVFVKPDRGQGSGGARIAHDASELRSAVAAGSDLVMEYLPGPEYTVDCFSDRDAGLLFCGGRRRVQVRSGISVRSDRADESIFHDYARKIAARVEFHGAWFFQVREDAQGVPHVLEIAARIAGTMALHRVLGVNFPLLSLYEQERVPISILTNEMHIAIDRPLANRYRHDLTYDAVYLDLDDTLLRDGCVNTRVIRFVFQCVNNGTRLVLLTRHQSDLQETLRRHRLSECWDEIIHLQGNETKAQYIREPSAILIDDSFRERTTAAEQLGIATFDASMIELLLDERV
jgi:carbamoyl-phosphate synthase large subunit